MKNKITNTEQNETSNKIIKCKEHILEFDTYEIIKETIRFDFICESCEQQFFVYKSLWDFIDTELIAFTGDQLSQDLNNNEN